MADEQTVPAPRGDVGADEAPAVNSGSGASVGRRKLGCALVSLVLVASVCVYAYQLFVSIYPDQGPEGDKVNAVADVASNYLSSDPSVTSAEATGAEANINGSSVTVDAHLKDGTSVEAAANLLASTWQKTLQEEPDYSGDFIISVSWTVKGSTIDVDVQCQRDPEAIRTDVKRALTPVGEAKTFTGSIDAYTKLTIDYGQVTALPTSLTQPSVPDSSKTFTMNGWKVTSTPKTDGQFSNPPFDQLITAAGQASPTGTIDLDGTTLSVTGLVTDERKGLTPEAAAPVVHAVNNCQAAGLTTLKLNGKLQKGLSSDDLWITFVCNNGTWASRFDSPSPSDTEILNKAAEL